MKKRLLKIAVVLTAICFTGCLAIYFFQEKLIFFPQKLDKNYQFKNTQPFEESNIKTADGNLLNALLFKADSAKGVIFYLHGNAGSLASWGNVAGTYTTLSYDVFMMDYRGYGKSTGAIKSEQQCFEDVQIAYNSIKEKYPESQIVVLGYSIGTGMASKVASENNPRLLILQAPYYSLKDLAKSKFPIVPSFLLKYPLQTDEYITRCKMPVVLFHGDKDEVIPYSSSLRLKSKLKQGDSLFTLSGQRHNRMSENAGYIKALKHILSDLK